MVIASPCGAGFAGAARDINPRPTAKTRGLDRFNGGAFTGTLAEQAL